MVTIRIRDPFSVNISALIDPRHRLRCSPKEMKGSQTFWLPCFCRDQNFRNLAHIAPEAESASNTMLWFSWLRFCSQWLNASFSGSSSSLSFSVKREQKSSPDAIKYMSVPVVRNIPSWALVTRRPCRHCMFSPSSTQIFSGAPNSAVWLHGRLAGGRA